MVPGERTASICTASGLEQLDVHSVYLEVGAGIKDNASHLKRIGQHCTAHGKQLLIEGDFNLSPAELEELSASQYNITVKPDFSPLGKKKPASDNGSEKTSEKAGAVASAREAAAEEEADEEEEDGEIEVQVCVTLLLAALQTHKCSQVQTLSRTRSFAESGPPYDPTAF